MQKKTESIEEFLKRGGTISKLPKVEKVEKQEILRQATGGPATFLSLAEADLFYGEAKISKAKKPKKSKVDMSALPDSLKKKFLSKMRNQDDEEE